MDPSERIDSQIAKLHDWRGKLLADLRNSILEVDPKIVEERKWMGTPTWSREGIIAVANPHKGKVKITFFRGAQLADPKNLFNAGLEGNQWRAIDFFEGDKVNRPALRALVREAIAWNLAHRRK